MSDRSLARGALYVAITTAALVGACADSVSGGADDGTNADGGGGGGSGNGDGRAGADDGLVFTVHDGGPGMLPPGCTTVSMQAEKLPTDLFIMMDSSESMAQLTQGGPSKWDAVRVALASFFNDPLSAS